MSKRTIRTLVVDDEPLARERLTTLLTGYRDIQVVGECGNGQKAIAALRREKPDLVFLDVQMPELSGFDVVEAIGAEAMPAVVFVTAYDKYALKAFEVHALDYLLKPFDRERFEKALDRARAHIDWREGSELSRRLMGLLDERRIVIRSGGRITFLKTGEIEWIEAAGNYVRIHSRREDHLLRETLGEIESRLDGNRFVRIHRSTIVNLDCIKELAPIFHGDLQITLRNGTRLTLSRTYRAKLEKLLGDRL